MDEERVTVDSVNLKCYCCGRMVIPRKIVWKEIKGTKQMFCSEDCYKFYLEYKGIK